jgi:hypothetical protein
MREELVRIGERWLGHERGAGQGGAGRWPVMEQEIGKDE